MRGISLVGGSIRAAISIKGKTIQKYFSKAEYGDSAEEKAKEWLAQKQEERRADKGKFGVRHAKRKDAAHQDLPIGVIDSHFKHTLTDGTTVKYQCLMHFKSIGGGKVKRTTRAYGINRTRKEALRLLELATV